MTDSGLPVPDENIAPPIMGAPAPGKDAVIDDLKLDIMCLICSNDCDPSYDNYFCPSSSFSPFSSPSPRFRKHLQAFFLVIHVLELPPEQMEHFLRLYPHPDKWVHTCSECSNNFVEKCQATYVELLKAQSKFRKARAKLINAVKQSFEKRHHSSAKDNEDVKRETSSFLLNSITDDTREFVRKHEYGDLRRPLLPKSLTVPSSTASTNFQPDPDIPLSTSIDNLHHPHPENVAPKQEPSLPTLAVDDEIATGYHEKHGPDLQMQTDDKDNCSLMNDGASDQSCNADDNDLSVDGDDDNDLSESESEDSQDDDDDTESEDDDDDSDSSESSMLEGDEDEQRLACPMEGCGKTFRRKKYLDDHTKNIHAPPRFSCHICGKMVTRKYYLRKHILAHETGTPKSFSCQLCPSKNYVTKASLAHHMSTTHPNENSDKETFSCPTCGRVFAYQSSLQYHVARIHDRKFQTCCDICGKILKNGTNLLSHKKWVHKMGPGSEYRTERMTCPENGCERMFSSKGALDRHLARHEKKREESQQIQEFYCEHCGKRFSKLQNLRIHETAIHTNKETKPFQCEQCRMGFASKRYLGHHVRKIHGSGLRKYPCPREGCKKVFRSEIRFKKHITCHEKDDK